MIYISWFNAINLMLAVFTLSVAVWAYCKGRRYGWLLFAAATLIGVGTALVSPAIGNARQKAWRAQHQLSPQAQKAFMEESIAVAKKYYPAGGNPPPAIPYRLDRIVAVLAAMMGAAGLWLIAQQEPRMAAKPTEGDNAVPPPQSP